MTGVDQFAVAVTGRPAPQGSKRVGAAGQLREQSAYLPAWRAAVKRAVYERYRELGIEPGVLPLFVDRPIWVSIQFRLDTGQRIDSPPDLDKLLRSTWDALTAARVWDDDGRVVTVDAVKVSAEGGPTGAVIVVGPANRVCAMCGADLPNASRADIDLCGECWRAYRPTVVTG